VPTKRRASRLAGLQCRRALAAVLTAAILVVALTPPRAIAQSPAGLTGFATLAAAYRETLDGDFTAAAERLAACEDAPAEACLALDAARLWWTIQLDPHNRARDAGFSQRVEAAIAATEAWTRRAPRAAEAWFYLGGAYGARVQWRVLRGERLAAARDGKRIKNAMEASLARDPTLEDAHFGIGLYQYYAAVAPPAARFLRWLLLLPGGNRSEGLARIERARREGQLLREEAAYQLHVIYLWYENRAQDAAALLEELGAAHPRNPLFPLLAADLHDTYFHDPASSVQAYARVLALARAGALNQGAWAEARARLGLAEHLDTLYESDLALEHARAVVGADPAAPYGAVPLAWLLAGRALWRLGEVDEARDALARALALAPADDPLRIRARAAAAQKLSPDADAARAYRTALAGWRAYEQRAFGRAEELLAEAVAQAPADAVARYRYGRVLRARGKRAAAQAQWELVVAAGRTGPPAVFAEACAGLAALVEASGDTDRARMLYRQAAQTFGAFAGTREAAERNAKRLEGSAGA
jgi:hypothetical protein